MNSVHSANRAIAVSCGTLAALLAYSSYRPRPTGVEGRCKQDAASSAVVLRASMMPRAGDLRIADSH